MNVSGIRNQYTQPLRRTNAVSFRGDEAPAIETVETLAKKLETVNADLVTAQKKKVGYLGAGLIALGALIGGWFIGKSGKSNDQAAQ
jgi:hypothetical protein